MPTTLLLMPEPVAALRTASLANSSNSRAVGIVEPENTRSELPLPSGAASFSAAVEPPTAETASKILGIIDKYSLGKSNDTPEKAEEGAVNFLALIYRHVKSGEAIPICLPAFPFKSPNSLTKVLGKLPDRAEELALAHMNGLCLAIQDVYPPGAKLTIISDGLVYNDLLGVSDKDVWAYGEALRVLVVEKGFVNIAFSRLQDLVYISLPNTLDEMTYVANATNFRLALLNTFGRPGRDWNNVIQSNDARLTYQGYIKFLETDLQGVYPVNDTRSRSKLKRGLKYIAREMLVRGDAFANAVRQNYKDSVRLSIHPSSCATKLSISLLPTSSTYTTPWHCAVAYKLDGSVITGMRSDFERDATLELVYENRQPSYFRERSELTSWSADKGGITCTPIYPCGWMIRPAAGPESLSIEDVDAHKVRSLSELNSPVVLRGFADSVNRELYLNKAKEFGDLRPTKFGLVLEVKDEGGSNNVLSSEWMPWHYDGFFNTPPRTCEDVNQVVVSGPPKFQFFVGVTTSPRNTGFTLFASSRSVFQCLPDWLTVEDMSMMTWSVSTSVNHADMNAMPLLISHPTTGRPCLRYHEPWPSSKTKLHTTAVNIDGQTPAQSAKICEAIDSVLHDRRVAYYHAWRKGDMIISDNILMMHTRSDFNHGSKRELWRIHLD